MERTGWPEEDRIVRIWWTTGYRTWGRAWLAVPSVRKLPALSQFLPAVLGVLKGKLRIFSLNGTFSFTSLFHDCHIRHTNWHLECSHFSYLKICYHFPILLLFLKLSCNFHWKSLENMLPSVCHLGTNIYSCVFNIIWVSFTLNLLENSTSISVWVSRRRSGTGWYQVRSW